MPELGADMNVAIRTTNCRCHYVVPCNFVLCGAYVIFVKALIDRPAIFITRFMRMSTVVNIALSSPQDKFCALVEKHVRTSISLKKVGVLGSKNVV